MSSEDARVNNEKHVLKVKAVKQLFEKTNAVGSCSTAGSAEKRSMKMSSTIELLQKKLHPGEESQVYEPGRSGDVKQLRLQTSRPRCTWTCGTLSGVARKRSKSRFPTSPRKVNPSGPGAKRERPYRQWLGVSSCVTADSKFIISSKPSRHSLGKDGCQSVVTGEKNGDARAVTNADGRSRGSDGTDQSLTCSPTRDERSYVDSILGPGVKVSEAETDLTTMGTSNKGDGIKSCGMTSSDGEVICGSRKGICQNNENTALREQGQTENDFAKPVLLASTAESSLAKATDNESNLHSRNTPPFVDPEISILSSDATIESSTVLYMTSSLNSDNDPAQCSEFSSGKSHSLEDDGTDNIDGNLLSKNAKRNNCGSSMQKEGEDTLNLHKCSYIKTDANSMTKPELSLHEISSGTPSLSGPVVTKSACACNTIATKTRSSVDGTKSPLHQNLVGLTRELSDILGDVASNQDTSEVHLSDLSWQEITDDDSLESEYGFRVMNNPGVKSGYQSGNRRTTWRSRMEKSASLKSSASLRLQENYRFDFTARARELTRPVRKKGIITTAHLDQKTPQHSTAEISYIKGLSTPEMRRKQCSVSPCITVAPSDRRPLLRTAARASQRSRQESPCSNNTDATPRQKRGAACNLGAKPDSQIEQELVKTVCSIGTETESGRVVGPTECIARPTRVHPDFKTSDTLRRARNGDAVVLTKHGKHKSVVARQLLQKISWTSRNEQKPEYKMVQAIVDFRGTLPGQLSFRKGQIIRQRCETENQASDLCYGSYSVGRLKKKRKGLFPAYCVVDYCPSS
ncbi:hypothetical protein Btru_026058 [Bulinus truncatus]|nr:hypothetical protein Btru_026058 [Bulinus truncatus]